MIKEGTRGLSAF